MTRYLPLAMITAIVCLAFLACDRDPVVPSADTLHQGVVQEDREPITGCADLSVEFSSASRLGQVTLTGDEACGPLTPRIVSDAQFDAATRRLRLPIALADPPRLGAPVHLTAWEDSVVVNGAPVEISFVEADSVAAEDGAHLWFYDHLLADAHTQEAGAVAGARTGQRWIEIDVPEGVRSFVVRLHAAGRDRGVVPEEVPDHRPAWFLDPECSVPCEGVMTGPCLINVVNVWFVDGATHADRQMAVDEIRGEVVGGTGAAAYYVRISHDGTTRPLAAAIDVLRSLPQVSHAYAYGTETLDLGYLQPADGVGWREWHTDPDRADGQTWSLDRNAAPQCMEVQLRMHGGAAPGTGTLVLG